MDAFEMEEWNPDVLPAETDADRLDPLTASTLNHSAGPHHDINSDFLSDRPLRDTADYNFAESSGKSTVKLSNTADMSRRPRGPPGNAPHGGLKGATWEQDPNLIPDYAPSELFPPHPNSKKSKPFSQREKRQIKYQMKLHEEIRRGPLYTQSTKRDPDNPPKVFNEDQFNAQYGSNPKADMDPFTGVETYSQRFLPKAKVLPKLSDRPFDKSLFPKELWSTLEGDEGEECRKHINQIEQKKALMLADMQPVNPEAKAKKAREKLKTLGEDADGNAEEDEDEEKEPEPVDDDFEGDEDEMAGDYDGEQYFENGEDDDDDGGEGGAEDY